MLTELISHFTLVALPSIWRFIFAQGLEQECLHVIVQNFGSPTFVMLPLISEGRFLLIGEQQTLAIQLG